MDDKQPVQRKCHVCGKEARTMKTSDKGWVSMCVNPDCEVKGQAFDMSAIYDVVITGKIEV